MKDIKEVIIDTDLGADADDCVALALAINLHKEGILKLDSITISSVREYAPNVLEALFNEYRFRCEVGQMSKPGIKVDEQDNYCFLFKDQPYQGQIEDAVTLLRRKLAKAKKKISLIAVGPLTNIARLLDSEADDISPKTGTELFNEKVDTFYTMSVSLIKDYAEWNVKSDIKAAQKVFAEVKAPIYIIPHECGIKVLTGNSLKDVKESSVYRCIEQFYQSTNNKVEVIERESWDPLTVLAAIGYDNLTVTKQGTVSIDDKGISTLKEDSGVHYVMDVVDADKAKQFINNKTLPNPKEEQKMKNPDTLSKREQEVLKRKEAKIKSILYPSDIDKNDKDNNYITLRHINKIYDNDVQAVFDFNLNIKKNEFIVLVGPSGCGKSTTLRMIAGLEEITSGDLFINSIYSNELAPKNRDIAMVFQSYALYPHMSVYNNLAFGIKIRKFPTLLKDKEGNDVLWIDKKELKRIDSQIKDCDKLVSYCTKEISKLDNPEDDDEAFVFGKRREYYNKQIGLAETKKESLLKEREEVSTHEVPKYVNKHLKKEEIDRRVLEAAKILEIENYLNRKPKALSGGQRQRVALGRAIVRNAAAFLMDEPLSNLDAKLRVQMRSEIVNIHQKVGATTIYVTHDQTEAMTMADRIVVMKDGMVQQIGTPIDIYSKPRNLFVAQFIGSPVMNVIKGHLKKDDVNFGDGLDVNLKSYKDSIQKYYSEEIDRLNEVVKNLSDLLRDKKHQRYEIYLSAKEEAEKLIELYTAKMNGLDFDVLFGIRPEDIAVHKEKDKETFEVTASMVELLGGEYIIHTSFADQKIVFKAPNDRLVKPGDKLYIELKKDKIHLFDVDSEYAIF